VFVVDDHAVTRSGYRYLLTEDAGFTICGEAAAADEAIDRIPAAAPDLVIVDIALGAGPSGLELVKQLHSLEPDLPLLVVSMLAESLYAARALKAGARGYVMKTEVDTKVIEACRWVLAGNVFVSAEIRDFLLGRHRTAGRHGPGASLTDRELEVYGHFGRGLSTREVATALHLSPKTVETHRSRIKRKLGVESTAEFVQRAVLWAHELGD